ncbi:MAG: GTPase HflX [Methanobacteriota archaeon]
MTATDEKRAILLSLHRGNAEVESLIASLGYGLSGVHVQRRPRPDPNTFFGKGKVEEIARSLHADEVETTRRARTGPIRRRTDDTEATVDLVVVNDELRASQVYHLEQTFRTRVLDRVGLILEIFADRARTEEARLQVELAKLSYEAPMVKEYINMTKRGEHPGFMAGGEYTVAYYYDTIRRKSAKIRRELERIRKERDVRRAHRRRAGYHLVSLAGYTNAGKSALLRRLSGAEVAVENRLFSTLQTTTRRATDDTREILVTDTVGFIEDLPPWVVDAFHSTLEEITLSDVIVLVLDVADATSEIERKLRTSLQILWSFEEMPPIVLALNKVDRATPEHVDAVVADLKRKGLLPEEWVLISALQGTGIPTLLDHVRRRLEPYSRIEAVFSASEDTEALLSRLFDETHVVDVERGGDVRVAFEVKRSFVPHFLDVIAGARDVRVIPANTV